MGRGEKVAEDEEFTEAAGFRDCPRNWEDVRETAGFIKAAMASGTHGLSVSTLFLLLLHCCVGG